MSATYANITEKVTAKIPDIEITAKYHLQKQKKEKALQTTPPIQIDYLAVSILGILFLTLELNPK